MHFSLKEKEMHNLRSFAKFAASPVLEGGGLHTAAVELALLRR